MTTETALVALACVAAAIGLSVRPKKRVGRQPAERVNIPVELRRKAASEAALRAEGIPVDPAWPRIEGESEARIPDSDRIARRALCLIAVALKGEGLGADGLRRIVDTYALDAHLTPEETAFLAEVTVTRETRLRYIRRYESANVLLWALGLADAPGSPLMPCDAGRIAGLLRSPGFYGRILASPRRPASELLDLADKTYRYHEAALAAERHRMPIPRLIDPALIIERHRACSWLIGHANLDWDDL